MNLLIHPYLPALEVLRTEGHSVNVQPDPAEKPLRIGILNLMPEKQQAELDLLRLLSGTSRTIEVTLLTTATHTPRHTSPRHLATFYTTWGDTGPGNFDGVLINGAPLEHIPFSQVDFIDELAGIVNDCDSNHIPTMNICWGALAALWLRHGIGVKVFDNKISGVFQHRLIAPGHHAVQGFDDLFMAPHSRFAGPDPEMLACSEVKVLASSDQSGPYLMADEKEHIYVTGHPEYAPTTLHREYTRDMARGLNPTMPRNYYPDNDPTRLPVALWRAHGRLLASNWLEICRKMS